MKKYEKKDKPFHKKHWYDGEERTSKSWTIWYFINGKRREESFPNKKLAEDRLHKVKAEIKENKYFDIKKVKRVLFEDLAKEYETNIKNEGKRSWSTTHYFIQDLLKEFNGKYIDRITVKMVEDYRDKKKRQTVRMSNKLLKSSTINHLLSCLRAMLNKAIQWGYISDNPLSKHRVKFLREPKPRDKKLSEYEINRLIECCPESIKPVVTIAVNTGMRRGEILDLRGVAIETVPHRNREGKLVLRTRIHVKESKTDEERYIPINSTLTKMIEHTKIKNKINENDLIFRIKDLRKSFTTALKRAGLWKENRDNLHFNDLRHVFATHYAMTPGARLIDLKNILGHKKLEMTMRYAHYMEDAGYDVMGQINFGLGKQNLNKISTNGSKAKKQRKGQIQNVHMKSAHI